jgi:hypothetical protein
LIALAALSGVPDGDSTGHVPPIVETGRAGPFPLIFDSETVRLFVEGDSVRVEGLYSFLCQPLGTRTATLVYPYPADSLLGGARTLVLEGGTDDTSWQPLEFKELPESRGALWRIPLNLGGTIRVRTTYRQALRSRYARYIVTTTHAWGGPLRVARFEIHLPDGALPKRFSFPFRPQVTVSGRVFYLYETENFAPNRDIVVEWDSGSGQRSE